MIKEILGIKNTNEKKKNKSIIKKPTTAYNIFMKKQRRFISESLSDKSHNEVNKEVAKCWKRLSNEEKKEYEIEAYYDSIRYYEECSEAIKLGIDLGKKIDPPKNYSLFKCCMSIDEKRKIAEKSLKMRRKFEFKKPRSAYILYLSEQYKALDELHYPLKNFENNSVIISETWNNLNSERKEIYYRKSEYERNVYFDNKNLLK